MSRIATLLVIISLLGTALAGSALLAMDQNHGGGCIASEINGDECPTTVANFTIHHLSALQSLIAGLVSPIVNSTLILSLLIGFMAAVLALFAILAASEPELTRFRAEDFLFKFSYSRQKISSWLSLFELSPAIK